MLLWFVCHIAAFENFMGGAVLAANRLGRITLAAVLSAALTALGPPGQAHAATDAAGWLPKTPDFWPVVVDQSHTSRTPVTHGVDVYSETYDAVGGRQHSQVLDVDLGDQNVRVGAVEAGNQITYPADETVTSMANRTGAVAGINGDYFDINATGRPTGGVIAGGRLLKSPQPGFNAQLGVRPDGSMVIGPQSYTGTVADGAATHAITSVNTVTDIGKGGVGKVTPDLGGPTAVAASTFVLGHADGDTLTVDSVTPGATSIPRLTAGQEGLAGAGAGGQWLSANVHPGDTLKLSEKTPDLKEMISGATVLIKDGKAYKDPAGTPPGGANPGRNPETAIGLSKDGRHATFVVLDGRAGESVASGVTPDEATGYLLAHGADSAILFDGGGSSELVARKPGDTKPSVMNAPSDGHERPVANGLFVYSTAKAAGAARKVVINDGTPVTTVPGATADVPVYATDAAWNPATGTPEVRVEPSSLATWQNGTLTARRAGDGVIIARDGHVTTTEPLHVLSKLDSLAIGPDEPDTVNGATQQFTLTGNGSVPIPAETAHWTVTPANLGTVDAHGLFTAAAGGSGLATVTATAGGASASTTVAVGSVSAPIDEMSDPAGWNLRNTTGQPADLSLASGVVPPGSTASGSLRLTYTVPGGSGVKQLVLSSKTTLQAETDSEGRNPTGIGLWVKGDGSGINLAESYIGADGLTTTLYPTTVTWKDWRLVVAQLPPGLKFPLKISFIDFLGINAPTTMSGTLNVSGLQALYSPRPVTAPPYTPIPKNPSWLSYEESAKDFGRGGTTLLTGDDAHMVASDPGSAAGHVMAAIAERAPGLNVDRAQFLGDMSDDGQPADLAYADQKMKALGVPCRDVVGNHEISQGVLPENANFAQVFGDTHYAYTAGAANVIVTDNAHGGLLSSDAYQRPAEAQYPWLVKQLTANRSKALMVITHEPAYDPHPEANSQFGDRWEARMYLRLIQRYQQRHRGTHVIMLYGHARGFAEQVLDPLGQPSADGVPQLTFADLGMPAYASADRGGFYHFGLIHVTPSGTFRFTVEPVLASIAVTGPSSLAAGAKATLTATGTAVGGDNLPSLTLPIADPASHVWSSSDPRVVSVDRSTGALTAHRPGTATVSVTSGGVTGTRTLTVTG
ncbi:phosphodiester glycosidase family protein [Actinoallomurus oryzae]|uniref:Phosphodiester glycosidase family protein n=1 Tax=Actinoallomurus oryzae TaxID=502180 RepID=A0ABP8Q8D4_9ACTN